MTCYPTSGTVWDLSSKTLLAFLGPGYAHPIASPWLADSASITPPSPFHGYHPVVKWTPNSSLVRST
eukprot:767321-Hanusia_phi.AAC.6